MTAYEWGLLALAVLTLLSVLWATSLLADRIERRHRERVMRARFLDRMARGHGSSWWL